MTELGVIGVECFKLIGVHGGPTLMGTLGSPREVLCGCIDADAEEDVEENNRSFEQLSNCIPLEAIGESAIDAPDVTFWTLLSSSSSLSCHKMRGVSSVAS